MELILKQDVPNVGKTGDIIKAKEGFARNYLLPRGLAMPVTAGNLKILEQGKQQRLKEQERNKQEALDLAKKLQGLSLTLTSEVHEGEKLYGSITSLEISRALSEEGFAIDKKVILLDEPIKATGIFEVPVKLHPEVTAKVKIWVVKK